MDLLRKECEETLNWKGSLILNQREDIAIGGKRLSSQEVILKKYHADFEDACASLAKVTAERNVLSSEVCFLKNKLIKDGSMSSSMSHASLVKRLEELENVYQALSTENTSLRIDVDNLRMERDTLVEDLDAAEVDLAEAQHSLQEQLLDANAKITRLEGQISSLEISRQFDATTKFKAEALQKANDQLCAQMMELRQKSASDLEAHAYQMKVQFERSAIDYINNAFEEAELQEEGVVFPLLPYP
ncbi:uncharacterized protein LOC113291485 [Papaver somniferum]|uniref:uncharacterized protein LOC113291485 n=1 Tax=Papaver somniferum TaxID=3469 RepID=UPI000E7005C6|nr:uncharacterized protein LOC113291485 [Papaver somniferum]